MIDPRVTAWVAEAWQRQGLPPTVEDPEFLDLLAADVLDALLARASEPERFPRPT